MLLLDEATLADQRWMSQGSCRDEDPELFFALTDKKEPDPRAEACCNRCSVRDECLDWAMIRDADAYAHGVWGGTSPRGRQRLKRFIARRHCPLCASDHVRIDPDSTVQTCLDCGQAWLMRRPGQTRKDTGEAA
jgi:WhiB family transcriptional regulator, redox-sensing transcriptional regulator